MSPVGRERKRPPRGSDEARAWQVLREELTRKQWEAWRHYGTFELTDPRGRLWRIDTTHAVGNLSVWSDEWEAWDDRCAGPFADREDEEYHDDEWLPHADFILAQVLEIKYESDFVLEIAEPA